MEYLWNEEDLFPPEARILLYSMISLYRLLSTLRDVRRSLELACSGVVHMHPDEADGYHYQHSVLEQQLLSAEATARGICRQLQQALIQAGDDAIGAAGSTTLATEEFGLRIFFW